jgi:uncharacterized protein (DUF58 family)
MKFIHWKSTARHNRFFVRQFEGTPAGDWWILLDLHKNSQIGVGWNSTEEHSVILASSLAIRGLQEEHPVGLAVNGKDPAWIVPRRYEYQQRSLLKALAVAEPSGLNLRDYLSRIGTSLGSRNSLIVITVNAEPAWVEALLPLIWRGATPTVFLLDPVTFGGTTHTNALETALQSIGVTYHIIPGQMLDTKQARPGTEGKWEWHVGATGKAMAVKVPAADWRRLG